MRPTAYWVNKYKCPYCEYTSTRNWNLETHIRRKHSLEVKCISVNRSRAVSPRQGIKTDKGQYKAPILPTPCYNTALVNWQNKIYDPPSPNDPVRGLVDWISPIVEFKKNLDFLFGSAAPNVKFPPLPLTFGFTTELAAHFPPSDTGIPFGFRIHLCGLCLKNTQVIVRFDREVDKHTCSPSVNMDLRKKDNFEVVKKLCDKAGDLLFHIVSTSQNTRFDLLHAYALSGDDLATRKVIVPNPHHLDETITIYCENEREISIDLDKILLENNGRISNVWFKTLIEEGWTELDTNDLYSYLQLIRTATFAFFNVKYKDRIRSYFVNLIGR